MPAGVKFGRRVATDPRDARFPMRLRLDPLRAQFFPRGLPEGTRHYQPGRVLSQGETGTCVAHAWLGRLMAAPIMQGLPRGMTVFDLYRQIVAVDEFPENDAEATARDQDLQSGTSVRAGAKAVQSLGRLASYLWAQSVEDVRAWHLAGFGGCVVGFNWYAGMMETDRDGFLRATGRVIGGHSTETTGWSDRVLRRGKRVRALRLQNSWPLPWGDKGEGRAWLAEEDLARLIAEDGEVCASTEIRVRPEGVR